MQFDPKHEMVCNRHILTAQTHLFWKTSLWKEYVGKDRLYLPSLPLITPPLTTYNFERDGNLTQGKSIHWTANNQVVFTECEDTLEKEGHVDLGPG